MSSAVRQLGSKDAESRISQLQEFIKEGNECEPDLQPMINDLRNNSVIGTSSQYGDLYLNERTRHQLDFMFIRISDEGLLDAKSNDFCSQPRGGKPHRISGIRQNVSDLDYDHVFKCGRTTGNTQGIFNCVRSYTDFPDGINSLEYLVMNADGKPFGQNGDSGSGVVDNNGNLVGLLFAAQGNGCSVYVTPISEIQNDLSRRFGIEISLNS